MTRWTDVLLRFFSNKPSGHRNSQTLSNSFIKHSTLSDQFDDSLKVIQKIVDAQDWIFAEDGFYQSESLKKAIHIGEEIRRLESYMDESSDYQGVDLNQDVLKGVVSDFLSHIDPVHYYAFQGQAEAIFEKVLNTPGELLPYVIDERWEKLQAHQEEGDGLPTVEDALRIFEYDLLVQKQASQNPSEGDYGVSTFTKHFADLVLTHHVALLDEKNDDRYQTYDDLGTEAGHKESVKKQEFFTGESVETKGSLAKEKAQHYMNYDAFSEDPVQAFVDRAPDPDPLLPEEETSRTQRPQVGLGQDQVNLDETLLLKDIQIWQEKIDD